MVHFFCVKRSENYSVECTAVGKFLWATLILFVCPVWPWALNLMNLGMSCPNEMPFLYPSRENITVKLKRLCIIALKKSQVKCKKSLFLLSFYFIHIRRICDFICSSTFKKHQAGLLMYLQKNINVIMNVETDLLGSVLVNHAEDFFFLHEYAILLASRCDEYSDHLQMTNHLYDLCAKKKFAN